MAPAPVRSAAAERRLAVLLDGFIPGAAALLATRFAPQTTRPT